MIGIGILQILLLNKNMFWKLFMYMKFQSVGSTCLHYLPPLGILGKCTIAFMLLPQGFVSWNGGSGAQVEND